jgi:endonuclease III
MLESAKLLKVRGVELLAQPKRFVRFQGDGGDSETDLPIEPFERLANDLEKTPHAFVLACLMDKQIKAERAWRIPYVISEIIGDFHLSSLLSVSLDEYTKIFQANSLHRYNSDMAKVFYKGVRHIQDQYDGNAAAIWEGRPSSAKVVQRFLAFHGAGPKIATMAANILVRNFKIPMSDHASIDVSPDRHIKRVFERLNYIRPDAGESEIIYAARELNPEYPGVFDLSVWVVGRNWCKPDNPICDKCYLNNLCPKIGVNATR